MKKFTFLMLFAVMAIAANAVTVYYDNTNTKWAKVNAYAWKGAGTTTLGEWPGTQMTAVDGHDGWFQIDVKDAENVIFNNGSGTQTDDLTVDAAKPYYKDGGWADSFGGEAVPEETKYFLKHPFDGANWEWKEMTKQADGTYTLVANWNGVGANVNTKKNDGDAQWKEAGVIAGAPATTGVEVTYVYDPASGALSIKAQEGGDDVGTPTDTKYFLKHPFDGANWNWKEMTKQENGTYTLVANWNGVGANVNTKQDDAGAQWKEAAAISGAPNATNVEVTYVYDPTSGTLSIIYTGEDVKITYYITGNAAFHTALGIDGEWNPALQLLNEGTISFNAAAQTEYVFKVTNGSWEQTWGYAALDTDNSNVTCTTDADNNNNIIFTLDVPATVTITFANNKICITKVDTPTGLINATSARIVAENGILSAQLDQPALVEVFALNGVLIDSQISADYNVALGQGIYVVRINGKAQKVVLY